VVLTLRAGAGEPPKQEPIFGMVGIQ